MCFVASHVFNAHATAQLNITMHGLDCIIKRTMVHVIYRVKDREKDVCQVTILFSHFSSVPSHNASFI